MDDLVKRLRSLVYEEEWLEEAAAEIARLRAALKPIVETAAVIEGDEAHVKVRRELIGNARALTAPAPSERD